MQEVGHSTDAAPGRDWRWALGLLALTLALYLPLANRYWTPSGDGELFIASARSIARGEGFTFNGYPVAIIPPGWPAVLAGAIKVCNSFLFLKLLTTALSVTFIVTSYFVLRRWASPRLSFVSCVLVAVLGEMYPLNFWLLSDPLYLAVTSLSVLLALRLNEGRGGRPALIALALLCVATTTIRWAGIFNAALIAGALLRNKPLWPIRALDPRLRWATALAAGGVLIAFAGWYGYLDYATRSARQRAAAYAAQHPTSMPAAVDIQFDEMVLEPERANRPSGTMASRSVDPFTAVGWKAYPERLALAGEWVSTLSCRPLRLARSSKAIRLLAAALGTLIAIPLLWYAWGRTRQRDWFWTGGFLYGLVLVLIWQANPRYYLPIAPYIFAGVLLGCGQLASRGRLARFAWKAAAWSFCLGILISNGALYACDVYIARSSRYYDLFEAGIHKELIAAGNYLRKTDPGSRVAVCGRHENLGRNRMVPYPSRATALLSQRQIVPAPDRIFGDPNNAKFRDWNKKARADYYIYQPAISPWRLWHFRVPWMQRRMTRQEVEETDCRWQLYEIRGRTGVRRDLSGYFAPVTQVPGV